MGSTTHLRRALKAAFFTHAAERGFAIDDSHQPHWTTFRRRVGSSVQIFEVQWDKYGRPRFVLHFGTCPAEGLNLNGTIHKPDETLPTWCPDRGTLQPRRGTGTRSWFRQDSTLLQRLLGRPPLRDPADVVRELLAAFPELERYWDNGEVGPHLRQWS
jgi:hypothetical protein